MIEQVCLVLYMLPTCSLPIALKSACGFGIQATTAMQASLRVHQHAAVSAYRRADCDHEPCMESCARHAPTCVFSQRHRNTLFL